MTPLKRGDIYYAVWTCIPGRCRVHQKQARHWVSLGTGDKREAKRLCMELETRVKKERAQVRLGIAVKPESLSLGRYKAQYLESTAHDKASTTHRTESYHLGSLIEYFKEDFLVENLTQELLEGYKRSRLTGDKIAPRSWNSELATLKSIFAWGLRREPALYERNPFASISRVDKGEPTVQKYIARDDIEKVMKKSPVFWRNVIAFLYCGMCRGSELRGLKWSDVDLDAGKIVFRQTKERKQKAIPIIPIVRSILCSARLSSAGSEYVFPGRDGQEMTKDALHHKLQDLGRAAGVKLSPHMLRHSGITMALVKGVPLFSVQKQAGHSQVTTTEGYTHIHLDAQTIVMEALRVNEMYDAVNE